VLVGPSYTAAAAQLRQSRTVLWPCERSVGLARTCRSACYSFLIIAESYALSGAALLTLQCLLMAVLL
jgi:hypothetical protein